MNPERVARPTHTYESWPWSSYRPTAGLARAPSFLALEALLEHFGGQQARAQRRYREFISDGLRRPAPNEELGSDPCLGAKPFVRRYGTSPRASSEIPRAQRQAVAVSLEQLLRREGQQAIARAYHDGYRLREIAAALGVHYSTVSRRLAQEERTRPPA